MKHNPETLLRAQLERMRDELRQIMDEPPTPARQHRIDKMQAEIQARERKLEALL